VATKRKRKKEECKHIRVIVLWGWVEIVDSDIKAQIVG